MPLIFLIVKGSASILHEIKKKRFGPTVSRICFTQDNVYIHVLAI
jgi:hypothetical protein